MWAKLVIGFNVIHTRVPFNGGEGRSDRTLFQALREGFIPEFDGQPFTCEGVELRLVTATDDDEEQYGMEMYLGRHVTLEGVDELTRADNEGRMRHTDSFPLADFERIYEETSQAFKRLGITDPPKIHTLTTASGEINEYDIFDADTRKYLLLKVGLDLEKDLDMEALLADDISDDNDENRGGDIDLMLERIRELPPRDHRSGPLKGSAADHSHPGSTADHSRAEATVDQPADTGCEPIPPRPIHIPFRTESIRDREEGFIHHPFHTPFLRETIRLREEINYWDGLDEVARQMFIFYRSWGGWIVLDNILLLEELAGDHIPAIERIVPFMATWKEFRGDERYGDFFSFAHSPPNSPSVLAYLELFHSVTTLDPAIEKGVRDIFLEHFRPVFRVLDPLAFYNGSYVSRELKMGYYNHGGQLRELIKGFDSKLRKQAMTRSFDRKSNRYVQDFDILGLITFLLSEDLPDEEKGFLMFHRAGMHLRMGMLQEASNDYRTYLAHNPDDGDGHYELGKVLIKQRQFFESKLAFQAAIRNNTDVPEDAWAMLGGIFGYLKMKKEGQACLKISHRLDPTSAALEIMRKELRVRKFEKIKEIDADRLLHL